MNISPRTFESHRAEAMRKLGARNTADLVRKALLHPDTCNGAAGSLIALSSEWTPVRVMKTRRNETELRF